MRKNQVNANSINQKLNIVSNENKNNENFNPTNFNQSNQNEERNKL